MALSRQTRRFVFTALAVVAIATISAWSLPTNPTARPLEDQWVRAHLDSVLRELPRRDISALSETQRERRAALIARLQNYRDRGQFPRNYDFPGEAVPYFTDRKTGALCAVGDLLTSTGRKDIVERVTRGNNNVRVRQLAGDTTFGAWLKENGLTLAEAARIQVVYAQSSMINSAELRRGAYLVMTPFALAGSVGSSLWNTFGNSDGHRRSGAISGIASGLTSITLGVALSGTPGIPKSSGLISAGIGGVAVALAVRSLVRHRELTNEAIRAEQRSVIVQPVITPIFEMAHRTGAGFSVSMKF